MQTVLIDVGEELNRMVALANLMPMQNVDVIEKIMLQLRQDPSNAKGAKVVLDVTQAMRELKSATETYQKFIIELAKSMEGKDPAGDASA